MKVRILHTCAIDGMELVDISNNCRFTMSWGQLEKSISEGRVQKKGRFIRGRTFIIQTAMVDVEKNESNDK